MNCASFKVEICLCERDKDKKMNHGLAMLRAGSLFCDHCMKHDMYQKMVY